MNAKYYDTLTQSWREANIKVYKNGSWQRAEIKKYNSSWQEVQNSSDSYTPNYSYEDPALKYKWGYYLLNEYSNANKLKEAYRRIYNAWKYQDDVTAYKYYDFSSNSYKKITQIKYTSGSYSGLYVYLSDLSLSTTNINLAFEAVCADTYELLFRWSFNSSSPGIKSVKTSAFILLPYYDKELRKLQRQDIEESFQQIVDLVKQHYGIEYVNADFETKNKLYTPLEKVKISKIIYDWIVINNVYENNDWGYTGGADDQTAWSGLSQRTNPVCAGYARAFAYCCYRWGITCVWVNGYVEHDINNPKNNVGLHAWNTVTYSNYSFLDSEIFDDSLWCDVDCTWGDPTSYNSKVEGGPTTTSQPDYISWEYFNLPTAWLEGESPSYITPHMRITHSNNVSGGQPNYSRFPNEKGSCQKWGYGIKKSNPSPSSYYTYKKGLNTSYTGKIYYGFERLTYGGYVV